MRLGGVTGASVRFGRAFGAGVIVRRGSSGGPVGSGAGGFGVALG